MVAHLWAVAFLCVKRNPGPGCGPISENLSSGSCEGGPNKLFGYGMGQSLGSEVENSCVLGKVWVWRKLRRREFQWLESRIIDLRVMPDCCKFI